MTHDEFQDAIVDLAHMFGWRAAAWRPLRTKHGWRTGVRYDGTGWPDLTLTHESGRIVLVEVKVGRDQLRPDQVAWGEHLVRLEDAARHTGGAPIVYQVWRPEDGDAVAALLSFGRVTHWQP